MRSCRMGVLVSLLLSVNAARSQPPQTNTPAPAPKDTQAVNVLNQALAVAGGVAAITAITDYTANGNITYNSNPQLQGSVKVQSLGLNEVRLDASLPSGVRSWAVNAGQMTRKFEDGSGGLVYTQIAMHLSGLVVPYLG